MKKRFLSLFTAVCIACLMTMTSCSAAEMESAVLASAPQLAFSDVESESACKEAIQWAAEQGYVNGYNDGRFGVNDPVTRQQLVTILWRWAGSPNASTQGYTDESAISAYAKTAVAWSRSEGVLAGRADGRFAPRTAPPAPRWCRRCISIERSLPALCPRIQRRRQTRCIFKSKIPSGQRPWRTAPR